MLMNLNSTSEPQKNYRVRIAGILSGGCLLLLMIDIVTSTTELKATKVLTKTGNIGLIKTLGMTLFKDYAIPFEISSVLFLSAMIGAVVIGKKE